MKPDTPHRRAATHRRHHISSFSCRCSHHLKPTHHSAVTHHIVAIITSSPSRRSSLDPESLGILDQVRSSAIASRVAARRSSLRIPYANLAQNRLGILNQVRRSAIPLLSRFLSYFCLVFLSYFLKTFLKTFKNFFRFFSIKCGERPGVNTPWVLLNVVRDRGLTPPWVLKSIYDQLMISEIFTCVWESGI